MDANSPPRPVTGTPGAADPWIAAGLVLPTYLAAFATLVLACESSRISLFWPADAVVLVLMLQVPTGAWWKVLLAGGLGLVCARLVVGCSPATALILSAINSLEILTCAAVLREIAGPVIDLRRPKQMLTFLLSAGFVAPAAAALCAGGFLAGSRGAPFVSTAMSWYAGDAVGLVVATPVLLLIFIGISRKFGQAFLA